MTTNDQSAPPCENLVPTYLTTEDHVIQFESIRGNDPLATDLLIKTYYADPFQTGKRVLVQVAISDYSLFQLIEVVMNHFLKLNPLSDQSKTTQVPPDQLTFEEFDLQRRRMPEIKITTGFLRWSLPNLLTICVKTVADYVHSQLDPQMSLIPLVKTLADILSEVETGLQFNLSDSEAGGKLLSPPGSEGETSLFQSTTGKFDFPVPSEPNSSGKFNDSSDEMPTFLQTNTQDEDFADFEPLLANSPTNPLYFSSSSSTQAEPGTPSPSTPPPLLSHSPPQLPPAPKKSKRPRLSSSDDFDSPDSPYKPYSSENDEINLHEAQYLLPPPPSPEPPFEEEYFQSFEEYFQSVNDTQDSDTPATSALRVTTCPPYPTPPTPYPLSGTALRLPNYSRDDDDELVIDSP